MVEHVERIEAGAPEALTHFENGYKHIVDSDGRTLTWKDPRIVHVWPVDWNPYMTRLLANMFKRRGWRYRIGNRPSAESIQYAKRLCSGRECLSFSTIAGETYRDLTELRSDDEVAVYYGVLEEGPCQNGAWPEVWEVFSRRLRLRNAVFPGHPTYRNNYVGQGLWFGIEFMVATIIGDLLDEAEKSLRSVATDPDAALEEFHQAIDEIVIEPTKGLVGLMASVRRWAKRVARIPRRDIRKVPRVLCFGGGALAAVNQILGEFFVEQGVISKVQDVVDFEYYLEGEAAMRFGMKRGWKHEKHFNLVRTALWGAPTAGSWKEYQAIFRSVFTVQGGGWVRWMLRGIAAKSGLLTDAYVANADIFKLGNQVLPNQLHQEGTGVIGRYLHYARTGLFDGLVHVSFFNCQPSLSARSILMSMAKDHDIPFISLELEGPWLTADHRRMLEGIVVQARRERSRKVESGRG